MVASVLVCLHLQSTMLAVLRATVTVTVTVTVDVKVRSQGFLILILIHRYPITHLIAHLIVYLIVYLIIYLIVVPVHDLIMVLYQSPQIALTGLVGAYIGWCLEGV